MPNMDKKMKRRILFIFMAITLIISGCVWTPEVTKTTNSGSSLTPSIVLATTTLTPTLKPTFTLTLTPTLTSTATPILVPIRQVNKSCITVLPTAPENKVYHGRIFLSRSVFVNLYDFQYEVSNIFDLATHETTILPIDKDIELAVSPDGMKYAVKDATDSSIKILQENGVLIRTVNQEKDRFVIDRWQDNENLILGIAEPVEGSNHMKYPMDVVIINIFTGKQTMLLSDYPDYNYGFPSLQWQGHGTTMYDPTMTRVVYPASIESDYQGKRGSGYVLYDTVKKIKLAQIVTGQFADTPVWSPDGSKFVINDNYGDGEFYVITRDGVISKVSQLNEVGNSQTSLQFSDVYSWSPDGRYLAFWLESYDRQSPPTSFGILDTETGEATDYCISAGYIDMNTVFYTILHRDYIPFWSPDGNIVVIKANNHKDGNFDTILIDMAGGFAVKITENLFPQGWLETSTK